MTSVTAAAALADRAIFSDSRPLGVISPRTSREYVCSERSSASSAAASSTPTNINDTITAIAAA